MECAFLIINRNIELRSYKFGRDEGGTTLVRD